MEDFRILQKEIGDVRILQCEGHMSSETYMYGRDIVNKLIENKICKIVFDLGEVEYISSAGWAIFIGFLELARNMGGNILLANMSKEVRYVFDTLELGYVLTTFKTVDEAVKEFEK